MSEATDFVHGSTVAINTAIERKGAVTALIVTRGTRDVYAIGRGNRLEAYNLFFERPEPFVPRSRIIEIDAAGVLQGKHGFRADEVTVVDVGVPSESAAAPRNASTRCVKPSPDSPVPASS